MTFRAAFFVLFQFIFLSSFAQKEGANWFFGIKAGLNFNSGTPVPITKGKLITKEGSAAISDNNGNLLFYTDGTYVYDRSHELMPNGSGLKGNLSTTQSAIIVPKPGTPLIYYIITVDKPDYSDPPRDPIEGVHYSVVDLSLNSGSGDIVPGQKNVHLLTYDPLDAKEKEFKSSEKIAAIAHGDCESFWVVTQFTNKFYSFKISSTGIDTNPIISTVPTYVPPTIPDEEANKTGIGYMKFNTEGTRLAVAHSSSTLGGGPRSGSKKNGKVLLYEFNDLTGAVTDEKTLLANSYPYGLEFSPSGRMLYVTANIYDNNDVFLHGEVYQYDLSSQNVPGSQIILNRSNSTGGALQLAIDGKIYKAGRPLGSSYHQSISVIEKPEEQGSDAGFRLNKIDLGPGAVELGLPQFIQSFLNTDFKAEFLCLGDLSHFQVADEDEFDSLLWDFGDGTTSTEIEATHHYTQTGIFQVTLTRYINNVVKDIACRQITIEDNPVIKKEYVLTQCDFDADPNDGITQFNLQLAKDPVTEGDAATLVYFYETYPEAENDIENQNSINNTFRNRTRNQVVFAKVTRLNSLCYDISEVTLNTTDGNIINPSPKFGCAADNEKADFDLSTIAGEVKDEMNLPPSAEITFHLYQSEAAIGNKELPAIYESGERTIFLRIENENICYGFGSMDLKILSFPAIQDVYELNVCSSQFPVTIGSDILLDNPENYNFLWNTGQTSQEIQVNNAGIYFVEIVDKEIGCGRRVDFFIEEFLTPEIVDIQIQSNGETSDITVNTSLTEGTLYAVDNIDGPYQESNIFTNLLPGAHTVYVKNIHSCKISEREILLFGFPLFFSPNNDGQNERWKPVEIEDEEFRIKSLHIYDRYGKLLKQLQPGGPGWDGIFNGYPLPSDDYWFSAILLTGRKFTGHFSLIR